MKRAWILLLGLAAAPAAAGDFSLPEIGAAGDLGRFEVPAIEGAQALPQPEGSWQRDIDLLPQFADLSNRDQCDVGSCHTFGSVAVLEAAWFRKHKTRVRFSEADLFLQRTVLTGDVYRQFCRDGKCELSEGNELNQGSDRLVIAGIHLSLALAEKCHISIRGGRREPDKRRAVADALHLFQRVN